jgi:hypothetical protein
MDKKTEDRTFAVIASQTISADGVNIESGDQVACITSQVSPLTLFGLMQFHGFTAVEVTTEFPVESDDESDDESTLAEPETVVESQPEAVEPAPVVEPESQPGEGDEDAATIAAFVADGIDDKTAKILVELNNLTPDELKKWIAEGLDLLDLDGIGETRAEKIAKVYPKPESKPE